MVSKREHDAITAYAASEQTAIVEKLEKANAASNKQYRIVTAAFIAVQLT